MHSSYIVVVLFQCWMSLTTKTLIPCLLPLFFQVYNMLALTLQKSATRWTRGSTWVKNNIRIQYFYKVWRLSLLLCWKQELNNHTTKFSELKNKRNPWHTITCLKISSFGLLSAVEYLVNGSKRQSRIREYWIWHHSWVVHSECSCITAV